MKLYKTIAITALAGITIFSCRKTDIVPVKKPATEVSVDNPKQSGWTSPAAWQSLQTKSSAVNYFAITDSNITASVAVKGLVLVYKKNDAGIQALPVEETGKEGKINWFYQVAENAIYITREGNKELAAPANDKFLYILLTEEQIKALEAMGFSRDKLMSSSYEQIISLVAVKQ